MSEAEQRDELRRVAMDLSAWLESPELPQPIAAEMARRLEAVRALMGES